MSAGEEKGIIAWFACNPVAANLLMLFIVAGGLASAFSISKDLFPQLAMARIQISAPYPGAAPVEVEKGVILPIESALHGLKGIKQIQSNARRDLALVTLDIESDEDIDHVLGQVKNRIDGIINFPSQLEKPLVSKADVFRWVMGVAVSGEMSERTRRALGEELQNELLALPEVKRAMLWGTNAYEISIDIDEHKLREFNLTFDEVAQSLRRSSLDLPAGMIKSRDGNIQVRTEGKAYTGQDFSALVLRSRADGTQLLLSDVASVSDAFVESEGMVRFDKNLAFAVGVFAVENQDLLLIDKAVKHYIEQKRVKLPEGLSINEYFPTAFYLQGRLDMMLENLALGAILVFVILALFLNLQVASWVMMGIPVSFLGAFWLMPINPFPVDVSIPSLFAFILVLGIVVDDAIVIGESIYNEAKEAAANTPDKEPLCSRELVIKGAKRVAKPATIGVLTTIAAFFPMLFIGGTMAPFLESISVVVILCLLFSLIESKFILPAHLVGLRQRHGGGAFAWLQRCQRATGSLLNRIVEDVYLPFLSTALRNRYLTLAMFLACLIVSIATVRSGIVPFEFFPNIPSDGIQANIEMHDGTSKQQFREVVLAVERAAYRVSRDHRNAHPEEPALVDHLLFHSTGDKSGTFRLQLNRSEQRSVNAFEFERLWRQEVGPLPGVRKQRYFAGTNAGGGAKVNLSLSGEDSRALGLASTALQEKLGEYDGVFDIYNTQGEGGREVKISLKPYAQQLGIELEDVARQVRQAFYGEEVQRIQRGANTIKVMVRYPLEARRSLASLENLPIRGKGGQVIDLGTVATLQLGEGVTAISRLERKRNVTITADLDPDKVQSGELIGEITTSFIPELLKQYPGVSFGLGGASQDQQTVMKRMMLGLVSALFLIYALLAIPLRSYIQPLIIMAVIPFGFIGALLGHMLFDLPISLMSIFGLVALSGVVINDSLILLEFANRSVVAGKPIDEALLQAGKQRFRAIILTTITTFVGLLPMLFETSLQAQFVIPMALSLGFGIVFATLITLILGPCLYRAVGFYCRDSQKTLDQVDPANRAAAPEFGEI